jgi:ABC-2 type transport system ATP-binding protein
VERNPKGSSGTAVAPAPSTPAGEDALLIEAVGLAKSYGAVRAVQDLSFGVRRGEILGLLGPKGAGKSTTLRMLVGFQYPDAGEVRLVGRNVWREGEAARRELGYLPEALPLSPEMDVLAYLRYFAQLKGVSPVRPAVDRVVDTMDLAGVVRRPCGNLSRGYRQRVGLAQALLSEPHILILDEPTAGLDPNQIHDFRRRIRDLGRDRAILLSTHILPEAIEVCDSVLILHRGRAVARGTPRELAAGGTGLHWARLRAERSPSAEQRARFALEPEPGGAVFRVTRDLDRGDARSLLQLIGAEGWELLEWQTGAAGLEAVFRRLTLGDDPESRA